MKNVKNVLQLCYRCQQIGSRRLQIQEGDPKLKVCACGVYQVKINASGFHNFLKCQQSVCKRQLSLHKRHVPNSNKKAFNSINSLTTNVFCREKKFKFIFKSLISRLHPPDENKS